RRFCFIADCSGSMQGTPLGQVKVEMLKTLSALRPESQFFVIFFNGSAHPLPQGGWLNGGPRNVELGLPWIRETSAAGGPQPLPAFTLAFQLNPRPDVIFFMTDGLIPADVPDAVARLNDPNRRVAINTIMFNRAAAQLLDPRKLPTKGSAKKTL